MPRAIDPLDLAVPRNLLALMQHLQRLVGREGHRIWCGGQIVPAKLPALAAKFARRYPVLRNTRQRTCDRKRGVGVVHFIAYRQGPTVCWWLLSDEGRGGLGDVASPDAHVSNDAMSAGHHIIFDDYVLLYAHKKTPHAVTDKRSGERRTILTDTSTWTWKLRGEVVSTLRAAIDAHCARLEFGSEGNDGHQPWGLRGMLSTLRRRPLFSGVRNQVIELHRYARDAWLPRQPAWIGKHSDLAARYGKAAGALRPLNGVLANHLPKMPRLPIYGEQPQSIRDLCREPGVAEATRPM